jgi:flavin-binding protein dodecin
MAGIKDYDTTAANNTDINSIDISEGCSPAGINNAIRQAMADNRSQWNDANWFEYGDGAGAVTITYVSGTSFTVSGADVTTAYHTGRRIKAVGSLTGTIYGTISSSSFSTNTTVNVTWDSGSLSNESLTIYLSILESGNDGIPEAINHKLDINGNELVLDADGDTSLTADTDDQIDVRVAGADQIRIIDGAVNPAVDSDINLGTNAIRYANVYADTYYGDGSNLTGITTDASQIRDTDNDTKIQTEESADEDKLRHDTAGVERAVMDSNGFQFTTNGGFVAHHSTIANDMSLTDKNMMLVGSVTISGTLTVGSGSTVVVI